MNVMPCFVEGFVCPCRTTFFEGKFFCRSTGLLVGVERFVGTGAQIDERSHRGDAFA